MRTGQDRLPKRRKSRANNTATCSAWDNGLVQFICARTKYYYRCREIDEVSELSNVASPDGSSGISSSSPASDTECCAEEGAFLSKLHDCRVGVGQVARFRCQVTRGRAVSVTWQHGDKVVENGGRYRLYRSGDTTHSLEIYFVTLADAGVVACRAISEVNAGKLRRTSESAVRKHTSSSEHTGMSRSHGLALLKILKFRTRHSIFIFM